MKWFKHFSNAHDGQDLTKVRMKYGADGYAIYWYCLELISSDLGSEKSINFELKHDSEVIGFNLNIDRILVEEIMNFMVSLGLFEQSNHTITCLKLAKYLDKKLTRNKFIHDVVDSYNSKVAASPTVEDMSRTCRDDSGQNPLDLDLDRDLDLKIKTKGRFAPPSLQEVKDYCLQRKNEVDPQSFLDHYEANGWIRGKTKIKDWKACVRTWEKTSKASDPKFSKLGTPHVMTLGKQKNLTPRVGESMDDYANRVRTTR